MDRYIFGRGWVYQAPEGDDAGADGAGSGAGGDDAAAGDGGDEGGAASDGGESDGADYGAGADEGGGAEGEAPKDMMSAIDAALGYKKGPNGETLDPLTGKVKVDQVEKKTVSNEEKHPNGKPKKDAAGNEIDENGVITKRAEAPKPKTSAELALKPEELKALGAKTQQRFGEMINTLKAHETTIGALTTQNKALAEGRDAILGVMDEVKCTQDHLAGYMNFHGMLTSGDPKGLERALQIVENQRLAIYKQLGREPAGGGIDLLVDYPDLKAQVEDAQITREAALELAKNRRSEAARQHAAQQQNKSQQTLEQQKKEETDALSAIDAWTVKLAKDDLDYKAKESKLQPKVAAVIKNYPPKLWLSTLQMMYEGIEVQKAPVQAGGGQRPLRPSGAKPGAKAPANMLDAISQGLGYATEKG